MPDPLELPQSGVNLPVLNPIESLWPQTGLSSQAFLWHSTACPLGSDCLPDAPLYHSAVR